MTFHVKEKHRYEENEFPTAVLMVQWMNGKTAELRNNWRLTDVSCANHDGQHWVGLTFVDKELQ